MQFKNQAFKGHLKRVTLAMHVHRVNLFPLRLEGVATCDTPLLAIWGGGAMVSLKGASVGNTNEIP